MIVSAPTAATIAAIGFVVLAAFQLALAAGAPWGRAAWGGAHTRLPRNLRTGSLVAMFVWLAAALVVLDRAGIPLMDLPDIVSRTATWILVAALAIGAVVNLASSSPYERFGWAPYSLVLAILTLIVALS